MRGRRVSRWGIAILLGMQTCLPLPLRADPPQPQPSPIVEKPSTAPAADKSQFTLFNPTPGDLMRAFNSDRPSVTESPYTVDAGHFQAEFSLVEYTYDDDRGTRTDAFSVLPVNIRIGLLNNLEGDLIVNPYDYSRVHTHKSAAVLSGFGDIALRAKLNLWGNEGGATAGGLLPYVAFPTASDGLSNHHVEGGLILPFAAQLPGDFALGTMADFQINRNADNSGYGMDLLHSITLAHDLVRGVTAYVEYAGIAPVRMKQTYLAYFDTGVTFALSPNVQLDSGINIGLSRKADDFTVFTGLSFRI